MSHKTLHFDEKFLYLHSMSSWMQLEQLRKWSFYFLWIPKVVIKELARPCSHLGAQLGKNLLPSSFKLLAELISLWLYDWGPKFLTVCWLEATVRPHILPIVPCHMPTPQTAHNRASCLFRANGRISCPLSLSPRIPLSFTLGYPSVILHVSPLRATSTNFVYLQSDWIVYF